MFYIFTESDLSKENDLNISNSKHKTVNGKSKEPPPKKRRIILMSGSDASDEDEYKPGN